jgi:hypothetical protein
MKFFNYLSVLLFFKVFILSPNLNPVLASDGDVICSIVLKEKTGQNVSNYPLTFAHVFKNGDVGENISLSIDGATLPTQFDIKRHYDNGYVRHAVISAIIPDIAANEELTIDLVKVGENLNTGELSKEEILATDLQSIITLSNLSGCGYSGSLTANLRNAVTNSSSLEYWLKGSVVTEILVREELNNSLNAYWEVRIYPSTNHIRISNSIENIEADYRGNVDYAVDITQNHSTPVSVYSKPSFTHNRNARWRKVIWQGGQPIDVEIKFDFNYLKESGHVMNYNPELVMPESEIVAMYNTWSASDKDIMESSFITEYFPTTGGRAEIGVLPKWAVQYLYSMDNRMKEVLLNLGELSGSIPIHFRESNASKSFYKHVVSIDDRPTMWLDRNDFTYIDDDDRLPEPIGETNTAWHPDRAHQASFAYIPYLVTGERYYLDEMYYWSAYNLGACNYEYRKRSLGVINDQVRGEAWAIRTIAETAALAPDNSLEKTYFEEKVLNNINNWKSETVDNEDAHPLHTWGYISCWNEDGGRPTDGIIGCESTRTGTGSGTNEEYYPTRHIACPWQDDFMLAVLAHIIELGYPAEGIHQWLGEFTINRFTHPDVNPYNGAPYRFPVTYSENTTSSQPYYDIPNWKWTNDVWVSQPDSFSEDDYPSSYNYVALGALSTIASLTIEQSLDGGASASSTGFEAYVWLKNNLNNYSLLNNDPRWAMVPREKDLTGTENLNSEIHQQRLAFSLYPNPQSNIATASYELPEACKPVFKVYDLQGKLIYSFTDNLKQAGFNKTTFRIKQVNLEEGIYFLRLEANNIYQTIKMVVVD